MSTLEQLDFSRIHRYTFDDLHILIDIPSGSLHVMTEEMDDYLSLLEDLGYAAAHQVARERWGEADTALLEDALAELIAAGLLFSEEAFADYEPHTEPIVKALCLHMAHDCNLRCGYCFADTGAYGGERGLMSLAVGKQALDFLVQSSRHRRHIEVDFFGGEPLLNFPVCKALVAYGRELEKKHDKVFKFTMTTNGVLLNDEVQAFLDAEGLSAVLSLDGRPETNDRMRPFASGSGSYDRIIDKFRQFVQGRNQEDYYIRGTYTRYNTDFAADVAHMAELGFRELSMEPVVAGQDMPYSLREEDLPGLLEQYDALTRYYLAQEAAGKGFHFFHFNIDLSHGPCLPKRLSGCGAGHDYLAVSPEGDLYPCHQFVGDPAYKIGHVATGLTNLDLPAAFQSAHVQTKPTCMACWARYYCSGGCHANNLRYGGSLHEPYAYGCTLQRKRLECGIYLAIKKALLAEEAAVNNA